MRRFDEEIDKNPDNLTRRSGRLWCETRATCRRQRNRHPIHEAERLTLRLRHVHWIWGVRSLGREIPRRPTFLDRSIYSARCKRGGVRRRSLCYKSGTS
jgi:hypothetical protein